MEDLVSLRAPPAPRRAPQVAAATIAVLAGLLMERLQFWHPCSFRRCTAWAGTGDRHKRSLPHRRETSFRHCKAAATSGLMLPKSLRQSCLTPRKAASRTRASAASPFRYQTTVLVLPSVAER